MSEAKATPTARPPANIPFTKTLVSNLYDIEVIQIKELNGYDDRNFYIETKDSKQLLIKITNSVESSETGLLEAINSLILHLYNNGLKVTVPLINKQGTYLTFEQIPAAGQNIEESEPGQVYGFRILEFLPGKLLLNVPFTPNILEECGQFLAKLTIALKTFSSPVLSKRKPFWSLLSVLGIRQYLDAVDSPLHRSIVTDALDEFESKVLNKLDDFEWSIVHGDFNEQNIIVEASDQQSTGEEEYHVKGVIDFGDVHYSPIVFDLAIFLAYSMFEFKAGPQILAPGFGLLGYMRLKKLSDRELSVLYYCIKARLCQSLVMGAHSYRLDPTNVYVLSSARMGWPALRALHDCQPTDILNKWLNIEKHFPN